MRKRIISGSQRVAAPAHNGWIDLERQARVELTSEDPGHPIEAALSPGGPDQGWRAAAPGKQTIRLVFDRPCALHRIVVEFREPDVARTQEFVLRWSADSGRTLHDIARQQWNFSPQGATRETEDYRVSLDAVTDLEITVIPDISGGDAVATLARLRLA
ncbi:MAG: carbohydrate-binding protein [Gammaproteobacteria bacterium]|jgi:hypothetical protein